MSVLGHGPVGPAQAARQPFAVFINSRWNGARVTWLASSAYTGPILIRGREFGGAHAVGFGLGNVPYDQLQLKDSAGPSSGGTAPVAGVLARARPGLLRATRSTARASAT